MNFLQLTFARECRGMTQTDLAKLVPGLSQSNLSKFEKGLNGLSENTLKSIMRVLNFPYDFLALNINQKVENEHFRKKATISAKEKGIISRTISLIALSFDKMAEVINFPEFKFPQIDLSEGYSPIDVAKQIRRQFKLGTEPITNIYNFLEVNGISVYNWDTENEQFDGVSLLTDKGNIIIVVNSNRSPDRIRLTLAHELGHIVMHLNPEFIIHPERNKEKEAYEFASELLMPEAAIKNVLMNIRFRDVVTLKRHWLTSIASIIERAKNLGTIDHQKYIFLRTELSRNGWIKKEPISVMIDSPRIFLKSYELMKRELGYNIEDFETVMSIPRDIIQDLYEPKTNLSLSICRMK